LVSRLHQEFAGRPGAASSAFFLYLAKDTHFGPAPTSAPRGDHHIVRAGRHRISLRLRANVEKRAALHKCVGSERGAGRLAGDCAQGEPAAGPHKAGKKSGELAG
jgi:hypothetical protein